MSPGRDERRDKSLEQPVGQAPNQVCSEKNLLGALEGLPLKGETLHVTGERPPYRAGGRLSSARHAWRRQIELDPLVDPINF